MRSHGFCCVLLVLAATGCSLTGGAKMPSLPLGPGKEAADASSTSSQGFQEGLAAGRTFENNGQWEQARSQYNDLVRRFPDRYEPYHRLGIVADKQGNYREAQHLFAEALRHSPNNAQVFNDLGYSYYLEGELNKAESAILKAVQLQPTNTLFLNNLGLVVGQMQRYDEALAIFRRAGSEADAQYNLAFIYASQERPELAVACFEQALAADPGYQPAREALESFLAADANPQVAAAPLQESRPGFVPYVEGGASQSADSSSTLAPRSSRLVRSARMADFDDTSAAVGGGGRLIAPASASLSSDPVR